MSYTIEPTSNYTANVLKASFTTKEEDELIKSTYNADSSKHSKLYEILVIKKTIKGWKIQVQTHKFYTYPAVRYVLQIYCMTYIYVNKSDIPKK